MSCPLVIIGAGGFGRETLDVVEAINAALREPAYDLLGFVDDDPSEVALKRLASRGASYLGDVASLVAGPVRADYVIGVNDPATRRRLDEALTRSGRHPATVVHPSAILGPGDEIGEGSVICAGAVMSNHVVLGRHVHVNPNATIGHDAVLGDFVSVNPAAIVSGDCLLEDETYVGSGAVILQGLHVGRGAVIGAAACVTRDVPADLTIVGVPARAVSAS
jgi:sugar O-acyltransferase (sialic acid O-acetyltransferase NeuD family)